MCLYVMYIIRRHQQWFYDDFMFSPLINWCLEGTSVRRQQGMYRKIVTSSNFWYHHALFSRFPFLFLWWLLLLCKMCAYRNTRKHKTMLKKVVTVDIELLNCCECSSLRTSFHIIFCENTRWVFEIKNF